MPATHYHLTHQETFVKAFVLHLGDKEETGIAIKNQNIDGDASSKLGKHDKFDRKTNFCGKGTRV